MIKFKNISAHHPEIYGLFAWCEPCDLCMDEDGLCDCAEGHTIWKQFVINRTAKRFCCDWCGSVGGIGGRFVTPCGTCGPRGVWQGD